MNRPFPTLLSPLPVGRRTLRNRLVFLPHGNRYPIEDLPGEREIAYYGDRAKGGVGLIIYGSQTVHPIEGGHVVNATRPEVVERYRRLTEAVHQHGALISAQLVHWGSLLQTASELGLDWQMPYGSSARPKGETFIRPLDREQIARIVEAYIIAARHVRLGGFDGIEIRLNHALLQEFVSPLLNRRTDEYGGTLENRLRLPIEVIDAVRSEIGPELIIDVRFCVDEVIPGGYGVDEGQAIGRLLAATGQVDLLTTSIGASPDGGIYQTEEIPPHPQPLGYAVYAAAALKKVVDLPVVAIGRITMPAQAEQILNEGRADLIGMARGLITDPEWLTKAQEGRTDDIRRCLGYNEVCLRAGAHRVTCVWNPAAGREQTLGIGTLRPADPVKRIVVIGGGPAGLVVAETAARRGHRVTLYEKDRELGGQLVLASRFPHREHLGEIPSYYAIQLDRLGVEVRRGETIVAEQVAEFGADTVVIATGVLPYLPAIRGINGPNVSTVWDLALNGDVPGERVLLYDTQGLWPALSAAELLLRLGKQVDLVTPRPAVGLNIAAGPLLLWNERIADRPLTRIPDAALTAIEGDTVTLVATNTRVGREWSRAGYDAIVLACGGRPNDALYQSLKGRIPDLRIVGDCEAPLRLERSIYAGTILGRAI